MSLTAVPVYLIARRLVTRGLALTAAALSVSILSMTYTGTVMTENAFYPVTAVWALLLVRTLERPTLGRQAVLVVAILVAYLTRAQAALFVPALVTAILIVALLEHGRHFWRGLWAYRVDRAAARARRGRRRPAPGRSGRAAERHPRRVHRPARLLVRRRRRVPLGALPPGRAGDHARRLPLRRLPDLLRGGPPARRRRASIGSSPPSPCRSRSGSSSSSRPSRTRPWPSGSRSGTSSMSRRSSSSRSWRGSVAGRRGRGGRSRRRRSSPPRCPPRCRSTTS